MALVGAVAAAGSLMSAPALAGTSVYLQIGTPAPYYYTPAPTYYTAPSYYYAPQVQYSSGYYYAPQYGQHRHQRRDSDRDGIPDRFDRDRDNDGVPNRFDRRPNNPYRY
jgi:hypothetical protein